MKIDRAIAGGELLSRVARKFSISEDSLSRHKARHLPQLLVKAQAAQEASDDLLEMVRDLHSKAHELLEEARTAGKYGPAASAIREATRCVELLARLKGELESERVTMNVVLMPEWQVLRGALLSALHPYPEARASVSQALKTLAARPETPQSLDQADPTQASRNDLGDSLKSLAGDLLLGSDPVELAEAAGIRPDEWQASFVCGRSRRPRAVNTRVNRVPSMSIGTASGNVSSRPPSAHRTPSSEELVPWATAPIANQQNGTSTPVTRASADNPRGDVRFCGAIVHADAREVRRPLVVR